jgi:hypothetical protein
MTHREVRSLLSGHPRAAEIARLLDSRRPHSQSGWRQTQFEDRALSFEGAARALRLPPGVGLEDSSFCREPAPAPDDVAIARDAVEGALSADERAALAFDVATEIAAAIGTCVRTIFSIRSRALAKLSGLGLSPDEVVAVARTLRDQGADTMNPHPLSSLLRPMTAEEARDAAAGYPVSRFIRLAAARLAPPAAAEPKAAA